MKNILQISLFAAAIVAAPALSRAQDTTTNMPAPPARTAPAPARPAKALVFKGTISAIDTNAMTFTVETRTFDITSETRITKDGQPAILSEGVVGEPVSGTYKTGDKGRLNAVIVRFGAMKKKEAAAAN